MKKQNPLTFATLTATFLVLPLITNGQTPCGHIIEIEGGERYEQPIEDCAQPFGAPHENPNITMKYGDIPLEDDGSYEFLNESHLLEVTGGEGETYGSLYKHEGDDYVLKTDFTEGTTYTFTQAGTYTLVAHEFGAPVLIHNERTNMFDRFTNMFVSHAHAAHGPAAVITFTITEPEEGGISNILFLPGIQASRIYIEEEGGEEKLWEPGGNGDVEQLAMDENGASIETLYTRDIIREIGGFALGGNIYKSFLQSLVDIEGPFDGPAVETFAYDWRRDVFDVVARGALRDNGRRESPTTTIAFLSEISSTGKTTIVAHSNGGLLAKAIMLELEATGKADLVDRMIMIGTPQIGTPKALAALLHGYDQEQLGGLLVDDEVVREVMENMPGAYGLVPSEAYINALSTPLISFDDVEVTQELYNAYGFTVTNTNEYTDFLTGAEGRDDPGMDVRQPSVLNQTLLVDALEAHRTKLDTWTPPEDVEVYEIVGIGLPTLAAIEYRPFQTAECFSHHCVTEEVLKPYARFTKYGDETVVSRSANFGSGTELYVDLSLVEDHQHADFTEAQTTQTIVQNILHGSSTDDIAFTTSNEPTFEVSYDIHSIHSPARIHVIDAAGNVSGRAAGESEWRKEIPQSHYFEFGESKYIILPADADYEVVIEGEEEGVYTLSVDTIGNADEQEHKHVSTSYIDAGTQITYAKDAGAFSDANIDWEGDGTIDAVRSLDGEHVGGKRHHPAHKPIVADDGGAPGTGHGKKHKGTWGERQGSQHMPGHAMRLLEGIFTDKEDEKGSRSWKKPKKRGHGHGLFSRQPIQFHGTR